MRGGEGDSSDTAWGGDRPSTWAPESALLATGISDASGSPLPSAALSTCISGSPTAGRARELWEIPGWEVPFQLRRSADRPRGGASGLCRQLVRRLATAMKREMEHRDDTESSENDEVTEILESETTDPEKRKYNDEYHRHSKKRKTVDSLKPPTVQELNMLRETENLFNSNLFRMQIEEMLKEIQMKTKYKNLFNDWLSEFKSYILGLEDLSEYDLADESWLENLTVKPPVCLKPATDNGKFKFVCPEDVTVAGSFNINACLGPMYTIDLHLHIPEAFFNQKTDQINLRFDRKRAFYLTILAESLNGSSLIEEINFVEANGCIFKPLLELKPSGKLGRHVRILLWPVTSPSALVLPRLRPGRGNIRSNWFFQSHISAQSDWTKDGISLGSNSNGPMISDFHEHFEVVFVDASGFCNLCAHMRKEVYMQVKIASAQAVSLLDTSTSQNFQALFMIPVEFVQCHDVIIRFDKDCDLVKSVEKNCTLKQKLDQTGWMLPLLLDLVLPYLEKGLGERVNSIGFLLPKVQRWACCDLPPSPSCISVPLILGLRLNVSQAFERLQRGPGADQPEAEVFRSFWGTLSQLRRFRDGSICEAVLWSPQHPVCEQVVHFVLGNHVGLPQNSYKYFATHTDCFLDAPREVASNLPLGGEAAVQAVITSFDTLTKQLRGLSDMTLSVNTVQGISPLFRYADVFPPVVQRRKKETNSSSNENSLNFSSCKNLPQYHAPVEAVMTLELSGKWPQNLEAVRRLKAAFCVQMAKALRKECKLCAQAHIDFVDIWKDGFVFRIWLAALKEVSLMKQRVDALGVVGYHDTPETMALEQKLVLLPKLTSSLHGLHQQFPGSGPTVCLAKRWLSSQLMGPPHFPDLVIELLVAYLFVSPEPFYPPVQSQLGLLHFLRLVSSTDWLTVPIIVNLNSEFTRERIAELETQFHSSRQSLPPLFLATPYDRSVSQCTRTAPTLQMLMRLGTLASEALKMFQEQLLVSKQPYLLPIFRPNLEEYDVIIKLKIAKLNRIHQSIDPKDTGNFCPLRGYRNQLEEPIPIVDFDPVQFYLAELREGYGNYALFFHDQYGGNIIGVVWKPLITQTQDFKVSLIGGHKPVQKSQMVLNLDAILEDFQIIGSGLVTSVNAKTRRTTNPQEISCRDIT
ncbi:Nucleolar protein 6 [Gryllus bimaculatus]|nr:Nucleolar protein 6 [Gryllus bimaculatus]